MSQCQADQNPPTYYLENITHLGVKHAKAIKNTSVGLTFYRFLRLNREGEAANEVN